MSEFHKAGPAQLKRMHFKDYTTRRERRGNGGTALLHRVVHFSFVLLRLGDLPRSLGQVLLYNSVSKATKPCQCLAFTH